VNRGAGRSRHGTTSGARQRGRRVAFRSPPPEPGPCTAYAGFAFSHSLASLTLSTSTSFRP
jgi:hypothetical protein